MKVLDRYVIRELIVPILYCSFSLVVLILIADLFDNLDDFLKHKTSLVIIAKYYACLVPYSFVETIPWAAWLGTIYLLVNFGLHHELLAMKVAGLKIISIIRPILFLGFLTGIATFIIGDRLVPWTYRTAGEMKEIYIEKKSDAKLGKLIYNLTYSSNDNQLYYIRSMAPARNEAHQLVVLWLDEVSKKTRQKISADFATWTGSAWELQGVTEQQIDSQGRTLGEPRTYAKKLYPELDVQPKDIANASSDSVFLSYREIKHAARQLESTGVDVSSEEVDMHDRLASPWQGLVMMLLTIPLLGPTRTRKGIAAYVLICIGLVFAYQVTGAIAMALGKSGRIFPFFSAWASTMIFSVGALLHLEKANY